MTAFEIAAALAGRCERLGVRPDIALVGPGLHGGWAPPGAAAALMASLRLRGLRVLEGEVTARGEGFCRLASGETLACDHLVLATGLAAPPLISALGLPVDSAGRLRTTPTLQSIADAAVFATGDCGVIDETPRPCAGVFGVRAAPVLGENLCALAQGRRLRRYRPQARRLAVMDLGETRALALRGRVWAFAPWALRLKRWLDRGFVRRSPLLL